MIRTARELHLRASERLKLFSAITVSSPARSSDAFFKETLLKSGNASFKDVLLQKRIFSPDLQAVLAEDVLRTEGNDVSKLVPELLKLMPDASSARDEVLEKIAWRLHVGGQELADWIEKYKSGNIAHYHANTVNYASEAVENIRGLSADERAAFVNYVVDPDHHPVPHGIFDKIEQQKLDQILPNMSPIAEGSLRQDVHVQVDKIRELIEQKIPSLSQLEKVPLIESVLTSGEKAYNKDPGYPLNVIRKFLGYTPGSLQEKLLVAYLEAVPEYQRSVALAYIMSQTGSEKGSVNPLFEAHQTVGIKFGQTSSLWKVFGPEIAKETAALKDRAKPMSKAEILDVLKKTWTPEEFAKIKSLDRIAGSASLNTVVEATLWDGRKVAIQIQRPFAKEQIEANLSFGKRFIVAARKAGIPVPKGMFDAILADLGSQLNDETDMREGAKKIGLARDFYNKMNTKLAGSLGGWKFDVPGVISDFQVYKNVRVIEYADGVSWKNVTPATRDETGKPVLEAGLDGVFKEGWFNPDPHGGNYIFNEKTKTIHPIDFDQAEQFAGDDKYRFAQFVRTVDERNPSAVVKYATQMSQGGSSLNAEALKKSTADLKAILAGAGDESERIVAVMNKLAEDGIDMDRRFRFGALKSLMMLQGEGFVPPKEFKPALARYVKGAVLGSPKALVRDLAGCLMRGLKTLQSSFR
jgi:predicted unusual protein kinase regulating ubiquinone biosynthesis (AarF/ABC1/UbiB family)